MAVHKYSYSRKQSYATVYFRYKFNNRQVISDDYNIAF